RGLLGFAPPRALAGQEQVFRELLADRRAAGHDLAFFLVFLVRLLDAVPVEALVIKKFGVLRRDDRALETGRDAVVRHPLVLQSGPRAFLVDALQARMHKSRRSGIVIDPVPDVNQEPELDEEQCSRCEQQRIPEAAPEKFQHVEMRARRTLTSGRAWLRSPRGSPAARRARSRMLPPPARPACRAR